MISKILKRPEILHHLWGPREAKVAVQYGADGVVTVVRPMVFVAVQEIFTFEQMEEGVQFAAKYGAKVYVKHANKVMHEGNEAGAASGSCKPRISGLQQLSYLTQP